MSLIPRPRVSLRQRNPWDARLVGRTVGLVALAGGATAVVIGIGSLLGASLGTPNLAVDLLLAGLGGLLTTFGVLRLRPRPLPAEVPLQPARTHLLYGLLAITIGVAGPMMGMNRWMLPILALYGIAELSMAFTIYRLTGFRLSGRPRELPPE